MSTASKPVRFGFTLIELLVVIAIIAILAAILFPMFASAREKARQTQCINNQKQLVIGIQIYAQDHQQYPGSDWTGSINIGSQQVFQCPDDTNDPVGYGMNSYLQGVKADTVVNTSTLICVADATTTSTTTIDFTRHKKGGIVGHLDGSVKWYPALGAGQTGNGNAGRFACGAFPLQPLLNLGGTSQLVAPDNFTTYTLGDSIPSAQFEVAGPYGDGNGDGTEGNPTAQVHVDYIGEQSFVQSLADVAPIPGNAAPNPSEIYPANPGDVAIVPGAVNEFTTWTVPAVEAPWVKMIMPKNYNCNFQNRTTYGVIYVYSPVKQTVNIDWHTDDDGMLWLNGLLNPKPLAVNDIQNGGNDNDKLVSNVTLPAGISFLVVKDVNFGQGMKFYLDFQLQAGQTLGFADSLN